MPDWCNSTAAPLATPCPRLVTRDHAVTCVDQFLHIGLDGSPQAAFHLTVERTEPVVTVIEALSDEGPCMARADISTSTSGS